MRQLWQSPRPVARWSLGSLLSASPGWTKWPSQRTSNFWFCLWWIYVNIHIITNNNTYTYIYIYIYEYWDGIYTNMVSTCIKSSIGYIIHCLMSSSIASIASIASWAVSQLRCYLPEIPDPEAWYEVMNGRSMWSMYIDIIIYVTYNIYIYVYYITYIYIYTLYYMLGSWTASFVCLEVYRNRHRSHRQVLQAAEQLNEAGPGRVPVPGIPAPIDGSQWGA